jgi:hypothetical protein
MAQCLLSCCGILYNFTNSIAMKKIIIIASIIVAIVFLAILFWPKRVEKQVPADIQADSLTITK